MRFLDKNIRLTITDTVSNNSIQFKAYLEDSDITYEVQEQNLSFAPLSFTSNKIHSRTLQTVKLSFNVFSEYREEAIENYDNLHTILNALKPSYTEIAGQYLPSQNNTFGLISLNFKGLPRIKSGTDDLKIHLTQFSYTINKDMGYIEVPYDLSGNDRYNKLYSEGNMRLVPIAYKLSITGRLQLSFAETARIQAQNTGATPESIWGNITEQAIKDKIMEIYSAVVGGKQLSNSKNPKAAVEIINKYEQFWNKPELSIDSYLNLPLDTNPPQPGLTNRIELAKLLSAIEK